MSPRGRSRRGGYVRPRPAGVRARAWSTESGAPVRFPRPSRMSVVHVALASPAPPPYPPCRSRLSWPSSRPHGPPSAVPGKELFVGTKFRISDRRSCVCDSDLWPHTSLGPTDTSHPMGHEFLGARRPVGRGRRELTGGEASGNGPTRVSRTGHTIPATPGGETPLFGHRGARTDLLSACFPLERPATPYVHDMATEGAGCSNTSLTPRGPPTHTAPWIHTSESRMEMISHLKHPS